VFAYIDRVNLSVALIDADFKTFFKLTNTDRGLTNSAFFWSYAALQIPAGWIVDRFGSKRPMAIGFLGLEPADGADGADHRLLDAVRHPPAGPRRSGDASGQHALDPLQFRGAQRGLAIGVFMSGSKFGPAIGAVAAAWLIEHHGWRAMFVIMGVAARCSGWFPGC
jgi:ACS family D-galactonate transporter-like MFS transporter